MFSYIFYLKKSIICTLFAINIETVMAQGHKRVHKRKRDGREFFPLRNWNI